MPGNVLIAYASRYGSTREVAEWVLTSLRERGVDAEMRPAGQVKDLAGYRAVVLGAPFYIGRLLKDARDFLERHQAALSAMPVALFTLGPTSAQDDMVEAREQMDGMLARLGWLKPVAAEMFVGKYDPESLRGLDRLVPKMKATPLYNMPAHDDRDWDAIRRWAETLPEAID